MKQAPFYLVWREGGRAPVMQHPTQESAEAESFRLARENPGLKFYVLIPALCAETTEPLTIERFDTDQIPF